MSSGTQPPTTDPPSIPSDDTAGRRERPLRWGAIALGAAVDIGGTQLCAIAISAVLAIRTAFVHPATFSSMATTDAAAQRALVTPGFFILSTIAGLLCSTGGGYLTAHLAKRAALLNASVMGICSGSAGLIMLVFFRGFSPSWSDLARGAATVPMAVLGGILARHRGQGHRRPG